jgi:hypothetical protein
VGFLNTTVTIFPACLGPSLVNWPLIWKRPLACTLHWAGWNRSARAEAAAVTSPSVPADLPQTVGRNRAGPRPHQSVVGDGVREVPSSRRLMVRPARANSTW